MKKRMLGEGFEVFFSFFEKSIEANLPFKMHCLGLGAMMTPVFLWDCLTRVGSFLNLPEIRLIHE